MQNLNLKRFFLYLFLTSVAVCALLGIGVILFGNFGEFETKILLTTLTVIVTSILGLACGAYLETKRGQVLPLAGLIFSVLSAILWITTIWLSTVPDDFFAKLLMSSTLLAASCSHLSLLSLAKLEKKFIWSHYAAHASIWTLTLILLLIIWTENDPSAGWVARLMGVLSIIIGALTIVTPIFHWLSRGDSATETTVAEIDEKMGKLKAELNRLEQQREEILKQEG